jgi:hypothetical protein
MALLGRKTEDEKAAEREAKAQEEQAKQAEKAGRQAALATHLQTVTKWEYQVKRVGEDKQKGILGSQRMEEIFNGEGAQGWELVAINEERATFKRPLPPDWS